MAKSRNYHIKMPEEGYKALQEIADRERRLLADIVREALEEYAKRKGINVNFEVSRGGYRERDTDQSG